jgi:hypothetical protein
MIIGALAALATQTSSPSPTIGVGGKVRWAFSVRAAAAAIGRAALRKTGNFFWRYGATFLFVLAWQLASQLSLVDPSVIPPFTAVVAALAHGFSDGALLGHMLVSLRRSGIAFGIAASLAIPLGL